MAGELVVNPPLSFDFIDAAGNGDVSQRMSIPQKITIPDIAGDNADFQSNASKSNPREAMASSMLIPDRIIVNDNMGTFTPANSDISRDLRGQVVSGSSMGGMVTPPRTLTVDDTKSAYYPQTRSTAGVPRGSNDKLKGDREIAARFIDDESIAVGMEVIEEGTPLDSDSDVDHYGENDVTDTRKCIAQLQQLNRKVRDLERRMERRSVGFWSKIAFFAFTIINPVILHWLFWRRR